MLHSSLLLTALFAASALSSPMAQDDKKPNPAAEKCHGINGPFLNPSFPDPSVTFEHDNWFSFGTFNGNDFRAAKSGKLESGWERVQGKVLDIGKATWAGKPKDGNYGLWAPDVFRRHHDNKFVMYFAAHDKETIGTNKIKHCIGAAISDNIGGVYVPQSDFVQCNRTASGVIDPAWFRDTDNKQYVVYKTEIPENWLEIREVRNSGPKEGLEWVSHAHQLIQVNSQGHSDGNNIEAPYIFKRGDVYFLAYSTHFTGDGSYDVQYAVAKNVKGPYKRVKEPLLKTTDAFGCKLIGPGGASFYRPSAGNEKSVKMIFHGLSGKSGMNGRVAYTATVEVDGEKLSIKTK